MIFSPWKIKLYFLPLKKWTLLLNTFWQTFCVSDFFVFVRSKIAQTFKDLDKHFLWTFNLFKHIKILYWFHHFFFYYYHWNVWAVYFDCFLFWIFMYNGSLNKPPPIRKHFPISKKDLIKPPLIRKFFSMNVYYIATFFAAACLSYTRACKCSASSNQIEL